MPGMVLFGRRWAIASDDLVFPGVFELLVRVLWWVGILMLYLMHRGKLDCPGGGLLSSYLIVLLVLLAVIIGTVSAIVCVSMKEIFAGQGTFTPHEGWMTVCPSLLREDTCMMPNRAQLTHQGSASICWVWGVTGGSLFQPAASSKQNQFYSGPPPPPHSV